MAGVVLDCLGVPCPYPVIRLAREVGRASPGDEIVVLADDPAAQSDIEAWCRMQGHRFVGREEAGGGPAFRVRVAS